MTKEFDNFIDSEKLLSFGVIYNEKPYCSSAFYAYDKKNSLLIISLSEKTNHYKAILLNNNVSGTIAHNTNIIGKIIGVQFLGNIVKAKSDEKNIYFKKFPFALVMKPTLYTIKIYWAKLTNNTLGFGKKIIWEKD